MFRVLRLLAFLVKGLPSPLVVCFGDWLGLFWFYVIRFRRDVVLSNLKIAFAENLSPREFQSLSLEVFKHFGRSIIELFQSIAWSSEDYQREVTVIGKEHLDALIAQKKGAFLLSMHSGNWELGVCGLAATGTPLDVVVKKPRTVWSEKFLNWYRTRTGAGVIFEEGTAGEILRSVARGRFVCCVLDQFMGPPIGLPVNFFGKTAGTAVGLSLFVERKEIPVLPALVHRDEKLGHCIRILPPMEYPKLSDDKNERLYQRTQAFNDCLERAIREYPEQWLWIHRRWKEYRGEPRWKRPSVASLISGILFLFLAIGCSSPPGVTPTGIVLPPDPKINLPAFQTTETNTAVEAPGQAVLKVEKTTKKRSEKKAKPIPVISQEKSPMVQTLSADRIPFELGERLEYDIHWMAIPAGKGITEVRSSTPFDGRATFLLWGNVLSSKIVNAIYSVDNTVESIVDAAGLIPYKFLVHMLESGQKKETRVSFDHLHEKAFYWSKRISPKWGDEEHDRTDPFRASARDMFTGLFYARSLNYVLNEKQSFPVYENGQNMDVELLPVANEFVNTRVGAFQCWKIKVTVKLNNVLKPTGDIYMWLSDDSKRYLVKFDTKVKIGSLYGNLVSLREKL